MEVFCDNNIIETITTSLVASLYVVKGHLYVSSIFELCNVT